MGEDPGDTVAAEMAEARRLLAALPETIGPEMSEEKQVEAMKAFMSLTAIVLPKVRLAAIVTTEGAPNSSVTLRCGHLSPVWFLGEMTAAAIRMCERLRDRHPEAPEILAVLKQLEAILDKHLTVNRDEETLQ